MLRRLLRLLILLSWLVAACQGTAVTQAPFSTSEPAPSQTRVEATQPETEGESPDTFAVNAQCSVVSGNPTPGATQESIFAPVSEADWVLGSDTADITIIEYSDFQ
jgi:protein-disulfide isomerase